MSQSADEGAAQAAVGQRYDRRACSICLERYTESNPSVLYPCGHSYHLQCAEAWFLRSAKCPVCDSNIRDTGVFTVDTDCRPDKRGMRGHQDSLTSLDGHSASTTMTFRDSSETAPSSPCTAAPAPPPPPPPAPPRSVVPAAASLSSSETPSPLVPPPAMSGRAVDRVDSGGSAVQRHESLASTGSRRPGKGRGPAHRRHRSESDSDHESAGLLSKPPTTLSAEGAACRDDEAGAPTLDAERCRGSSTAGPDAVGSDDLDEAPAARRGGRGRSVGIRSIPQRVAATASYLLCCWRFR